MEKDETVLMSCLDQGHNFVAIETTPPDQLHEKRIFRLFCTKCGQKRDL